MRQYHKIVYTYMHVKMTALANSLNQKKKFHHHYYALYYYYYLILQDLFRVLGLLLHSLFRTNLKINFVIDIRQLDMRPERVHFFFWTDIK